MESRPGGLWHFAVYSSEVTAFVDLVSLCTFIPYGRSMNDLLDEVGVSEDVLSLDAHNPSTTIALDRALRLLDARSNIFHGLHRFGL